MNRFAIAAPLLALCIEAQAAGGIGNVFGALMGRSGDMRSGADIDETLAQVTAQINRKTPMAIDNETRLDRVSAEPGARLAYHYTLVKVRSGELDPAGFINSIRPQLKTRLCSSQEMQGFLKNGVRISYLYQTSDGRSLGGTEFTPVDCGYKA